MSEEICDHILGLVKIDITGGFYIVCQSDCACPEFPFQFCPDCGTRLNFVSETNEASETENEG